MIRARLCLPGENRLGYACMFVDLTKWKASATFSTLRPQGKHLTSRKIRLCEAPSCTRFFHPPPISTKHKLENHTTLHPLQMSGLEAVAAFALACNIMQVVESAYKTVGACKRIYQTGEPDPALGDYGGQLRGISDALGTQLKNAVGPLSQDDTRLRDLAVRCTTIANGLTDQIASVSKSAGKRTISSSMRLAVKSRFKQGDLTRWEKDLAKVQSVMETQLLVGLRLRLDANMLQNDEMDRDLKYFVRQLSDGQTSLSDLVLQQTHELKEEICKGLADAEVSTKTHITTELVHNDNRMQNHLSKALGDLQVVAEKQTQEESDSRAQEEGYRRLLGSLKFPDMEARRNHVSHACPKTFRWIFDSQDSSSDDEYDETEDDEEDTEDNNERNGNDNDDYDDDDYDDNDDDGESNHSTGSIDSGISASSNSSHSPTWDSLIKWLQSSEPVYWISGKPASGKSTLMKFIMSHDRTKPLLKQWQENVRILSHFFWRPGTELQQSIKGLLCSLLHQIFVEDKDQASSYLKTRRELSRKDSPSDWDPKELEALFIDCLQCPSTAFCIFIDGLDEVWPKDGVNSLTFLLNTFLRKTKHLKLCVSSRREHLLEIRLRHYPQLKMHDLTQNDLKEYATQTLSEASAHSNLDSRDMKEIIWRIVQASDGVFLWVVLVSNSLSRGLQNGDSREELFQRLDSLPRDLEGLYLDMWLRQNGDDEIYRNSSSKLLYLCLVGLGWKEKPGFVSYLPVFQLMAAMDGEGPEDDLIYPCHPVEELRRRCEATIKIIQVRSAGLLEVFNPKYRFQDDPAYEHVFGGGIRFIHRSAQDFLTDTQQGQTVWANHGMTYDSACTKLYLAQTTTLSFLIKQRSKDPFPLIPISPQLPMLANHCNFLEPSTIRYCLQKTAERWHRFNLPAIDQTLPGHYDMLTEAAHYGFFEYASEQLCAEQNESSAVPRLFLHLTCTHGWMRLPVSNANGAGRNHGIEGQCRLLRLFLDKVAFRDPKPFILPPVGDGGPCHSIHQILGGFLLFIRDSLDFGIPAPIQTLLDTLGAFEGTPVDLADKLLLNLVWDSTCRVSDSHVDLSLFEPGATMSPGRDGVQVEISLCDWVDATRNNLQLLIAGHRPVLGDGCSAPHVQFVSLLSRNTARALCRYTPNESEVQRLSQMAQGTLYFPFSSSAYAYINPLEKAFIHEVIRLREGWAESVLEPWPPW